MIICLFLGCTIYSIYELCTIGQRRELVKAKVNTPLLHIRHINPRAKTKQTTTNIIVIEEIKGLCIAGIRLVVNRVP